MEIWQPARDRAVRLPGQKSPHFTRSGPGRIHNHSGTESQFWTFDDFRDQIVRRFNPGEEYGIRTRLNRFTKTFDKIDRSPNPLKRFYTFIGAMGITVNHDREDLTYY
jgi:hypothetical protein